MKKRIFKLDERVDLPKNVSVKSFEDQDLIIAVDNPNWIIATPLESRIFGYLREGLTIRDAGVAVYRDGVVAGSSEERVRVLEDAVTSLLTNVERYGFYEGMTVPNPQDLALHLYLTNKCNIRCRQCYKDAGNGLPNELSTEEIKGLIDVFSEHSHNSQVVLSGGEPLLKPDFFEIARYIRDRGHSVNVVTNGILIDSVEVARRLVDVTDYLQISLDGCSAEANDYYRGKGTFDKIIRAINFVGETGARVNIGMVVSEKNIDDLRANLGVLIREKIKYDKIGIKFSGIMEFGRGKNCQDDLDTFAVVDEAFKIAKAEGISEKVWREPNTKAFDCGYARSVTVDSDGSIYLCPVTDAVLLTPLNVRTTSFGEVVSYFKDANALASIERIDGCNACDLEYICGGGCRHENLKSRGSIGAVDCYEGRKERIYAELVKTRIKERQEE